MASTITYIVVPFALKRGKLAAGTSIPFNDRARAERSAEALSMTRAGVLVLEQSADAGSDLFDEPRLVKHFGQIPDEMFQFT